MSIFRLSLLVPFTSLAVACAGGDDTGSGSGVGADIYATDCASCHGADGTGTASGVSLVDVVPGKSESDVVDVVTNGKGDMAPLTYLGGEEVADVAAYVIDQWG